MVHTTPAPTCNHHIDDDPTGLRCCVLGAHATHVYEASSCPQANDTEAQEG